MFRTARKGRRIAAPARCGERKPMTQTTKTIIQAALDSDGTIPAEVVNAALRILAENKADATPGDVGQVMRASEVAKRLAVSTRTVRAFARRGLLRPVKGGGKKRLGFLAEDVRAFMEGRALVASAKQGVTA